MPIKTEWENLAKHLRFLYQLSDNSALSLQYTDEDGDLVSLSTEFELRDVLEQAGAEGKRTVKFTLLVSELPPPVPVDTVEEGFDVVTSMEEPDMGELVQAVEVEQLVVEEREEQVYREAVAEEELREDPVIVQAALEIQAQEEGEEEDPVLVEQVKHVQVDVEEDEEDEESLYAKPNESVKVEEDDLPPYVVARNEEEQEEEHECQTEEQREEEESSGSNKGKQPANLSLAEQLHGLVDQFVGILEQHPEFVAQASIFKDRIMNNGKIDIHIAAKFVENEDNQENTKRKAKCSHKEDKKCKKDIKVELQWGGEQENHHSHHHHPHHPHHHPHHQYHHHHQHHQQQPSSSFSFQPLCTPQIQPFPVTVSASDQSCPRRSARVTAQRVSSEFHEKPYSSGRKQQDNAVEDAVMSAPPSRARCFKRTVHQAAGRPHCSRRRSSPNNMPPDAVVEQEVNEKMIILSEMGFMDQELNKMLLQENNDDVAKVVDILMSRE